MKNLSFAPNTGYVLSELIVDGNAVTTASSYEFTNVLSNHTITAIFSPISYTISYNLDGGTVTGNPTTYTIEDAITLVNPTKDGYNFTGWTGSNGTTPSTTVTIAKGSTGNRTYTANWELANVAPTTPTVTLSSKTTNSFNVRAVSTDANGDSLIYSLYVDGSLKSTSASTQSGTATTFSVTGLGEYTSHNYYVTVSDGTLTTTSSTKSVRTYCNTFNTKKTCDDCIDGIKKCPGTKETRTYSLPTETATCEECGTTVTGVIGSPRVMYRCTSCLYITCKSSEFSAHKPVYNNNYGCTTCGGSEYIAGKGYIYTCVHGYTSQHD